MSPPGSRRRQSMLQSRRMPAASARRQRHPTSAVPRARRGTRRRTRSATRGTTSVVRRTPMRLPSARSRARRSVRTRRGSTTDLPSPLGCASSASVASISPSQRRSIRAIRETTAEPVPRQSPRRTPSPETYAHGRSAAPRRMRRSSSLPQTSYSVTSTWRYLMPQESSTRQLIWLSIVPSYLLSR